MTATTDIPTSIVDAQVQRLLEIVKDYQQEQCDTLLAQARRQSQLIVRQAYRDARLRLHRDIQDSRKNMQDELSATRARLHTLLMQQRHRADKEFLSQSWQLLENKLLQRWQKPGDRQLWVKKIVAVAIRVLPGLEWEISHPPDWPASEQNQLTELVNSNQQRQLVFHSDSNTKAGICISADGAAVNGTLQGLMADQARIESEILAQCRECIVHSHEVNQETN